MSEEEQRNSNRLNMVDQMYGYEQPLEEEQQEEKSIAQQMIDAIQQRRRAAFGGVKRTF